MDWNKFNNLTILIIDDDEFTRELIRTILKDVPNITIHQASDGIEALTMLEVNKYDMLFLDLYMPKMSGEEFIESLNRQNQFENSIPIVLITTDRLSRIELKNIGAKYYLTKPFDFYNFLNNIYGFLEKELFLNET